jgi:hypothetical protein
MDDERALTCELMLRQGCSIDAFRSERERGGGFGAHQLAVIAASCRLAAPPTKGVTVSTAALVPKIVEFVRGW